MEVLARGDFRREMYGTKAVSRVQQVVRTAQQADVRNVSCAEPGMGFDVIEFEKGPGRAAPAVCRNERALPAVPTVRFSPHRHGHVTSTFAGRKRASFLTLHRFGCCG